MPTCEKCWRDAGGNPDRYRELLKERDDRGEKCTPEEQAGGEDAELCPSCGRKALHLWCNVCMACGRHLSNKEVDRDE